MGWVHAVIDVPDDLHIAATDFWGRALGWSAGAPWSNHAELCSFEPPVGKAYVHLQRIVGRARIHLDIESATPDATVEQAVGLGADLVARRDRWQTLTSPGGLPFCVLQADPARGAEPIVLPDGHRTRLVQICIDSPRSVHATEVHFWRALLGGRWVDSDSAEFAGKWHDDEGSPIQLLFQELDETSGAVRAHFDLGTDDLHAEVRRLTHLGAQDIGPGRGWHALRDAVGLPFCVTGNSPELTTHRDLG